MKMLTATALAVLMAFGAATPAEAKGFGPTRQEEMMKRFDGNADGKISQAEIDDWRSKRVGQFNTDGQDGLTIAEYERLWLDAHHKQMVRRFQMLDEDGNGVVTTEEFTKPMSRLVERVDRNNSGDLSIDELKPRKRGGEGRGHKSRGHRAGRHGGDDGPRAHHQGGNHGGKHAGRGGKAGPRGGDHAARSCPMMQHGAMSGGMGGGMYGMPPHPGPQHGWGHPSWGDHGDGHQQRGEHGRRGNDGYRGGHDRGDRAGFGGRGGDWGNRGDGDDRRGQFRDAIRQRMQDRMNSRIEADLPPPPPALAADMLPFPPPFMPDTPLAMPLGDTLSPATDAGELVIEEIIK